MKTLYQQLRIPPQASPKAIHQAFLRLARKFDPALHQSQAHPDAQAQYEEIYKAYRTLMDPDRRYVYDQSLQMQPYAQRGQTPRFTGGERKIAGK